MRQPRNHVDPRAAYAQLVEPELNRHGIVEAIGTLFLTNRECPFQCTMCDLWKNTLEHSVKPGDIPHQIKRAVDLLPSFQSIKLYNSGNFFDAAAIPVADHPLIAHLVCGYNDCIVENHPNLVGPRCRDFAQMILPAQLEIALGLETVHEPSLQWLNKSMALAEFDRAVEQLHSWQIQTRVFLLLGLPNLEISESLDWAMKSIDHAAAKGVRCFSLIPTRSTMPALGRLAAEGRFHRPTGTMIERALEYGIQKNRGRVFMDLWDAGQFFACDHCRAARLQRLQQMNLQQNVLPAVDCDHCGSLSDA